MDVLGRARGLVVLVEDQLTRRDVENAWGLLDANEPGVAVELVATQLVEHEAVVDEETVRLVRSLCEEMGLRDDVWRSLRGTAPDEVAETLRPAGERRGRVLADAEESSMNDVLELLVEQAGEPGHDVPTSWVLRVADSMSREPGRWSAAAERLDDGGSWQLLGFVEHAASLIAREGSLRLAEQAGFAVALLEGGPLDRRDVIIVADLLPRACDRAGLDFAATVRAGCARAGERGESCQDWLLQRPVGSSLYEEVGEGSTFRYRRRPAGFDGDDLLDRLERHRKDR